MPLRRSFPVFVLAISLVVVLNSCDSSRVFEDNHEFPNRQWLVSEEPAFEFVVTDSARTYNLYYNLRNSLNYEWDRIYVTYVLTDSAGQELAKKLVYNELFDPTGQPHGESGIGDIYDHRFPILTHYQFPRSGKYAIRLKQYSRQDTLRGVLAVGVRVELEGLPK
ncbi:MAG: gliding motility lipoprotein GldH [Cyclobacteriaceae bacterium]|nr:gliding motility lipoprotein GldH [Cyclobacteriaceae bacterium]